MRTCPPAVPRHSLAIFSTRRLLTLLAGALSCAALAPTAHAAMPIDFVGIHSEDAFAGDTAYRDRAMARQSRAGIGLNRRTFSWADIEQQPGVYTFARYDAFVAAAARRRIRILPVLYDPPAFSSTRPPGDTQAATFPPSDLDAFGRFAAAVARRYGRRGSFWGSHRQLPYTPIVSYQIWNEPNLAQYWATGPDPAEYAAMLRTVGPAVKRVEPGAEIVTAGVPDSKKGIRIVPFYEALYRAGGRGLFDTVAVNAYAPTAQSLANKLRNVRRLMRRHGHRRGRVWVTEFGWADGAPGLARHPLLVGPREQGRRIAAAIRKLGAMRHPMRIRGFVYYGWRDLAPYGPRYADFWGLHTGLLTRSGTPKPALRRFQAAVERLKARARRRARSR